MTRVGSQSHSKKKKIVLGNLYVSARPRTQHDYHHVTKVKPEAATAVIELLMTGGKTPETCWAVNNHQDNKLENCCIWLVIYLNKYIYIWAWWYVQPTCSRLFPIGVQSKCRAIPSMLLFFRGKKTKLRVEKIYVRTNAKYLPHL